jgi:hypothetical protein
MPYSNPVNKQYKSPTPGAITILAWGPATNDQGLTADYCKVMAECGFNSTQVTVTITEVSNTLANCGKYGIFPFMGHIHLSRSEAECKSYVNAYKGNPYLGGWFLTGQTVLGQLSPTGDMKKAYDWISSFDPVTSPTKENPSGSGHVIYIGLQGDSTASHLGTSTYKQYIEKFQNVIQPSFFPYNMGLVYVLANGTVQKLYDQFFLDLEIFSLLSLYAERPFWAFVRCQAYVKSNGGSGPAPTVAQMRFAAFSALAYGAQGIVYDRYRQDSNTSDYTFSLAPLDREGNKTDTWNYVKEVNTDIKALNSVFFETEAVIVRHTGKTQYAGTSMLKGAIGPIVQLVSQDAGVLVSHLNTNGTNYIVIVNHDIDKSQLVILDFSDFWKVYRVYVSQGKMIKSLLTTTHTFYTIPAGGYLIFTWE